ncbi:hypothetical protein [Sphingomonas sp. Leaf226]|uniref:Abi-alpha family protein n=1 Tax=Sphingomonas sp. Leaf226 TaxID=1735691 RepID=UPI000B2E3131|nr:hypothetical protein [Sphingomonas sp. Leaf226]
MGEDIGKVAEAIVGPPAGSFADVYGVVIGDRIANWRLQNVIRAHAKVQSVADAAGLKMVVAKIPERFAYSWFEEVSKQDNGDLQTLFAKLLARAAAGQIAPDERLTRMLSLFTPSDARVFNAFYAAVDPSDKSPLMRQAISRRQVARGSFIDKLRTDMPEEAAKSVEALENIGCFQRRVRFGKKVFAYDPSWMRSVARGQAVEPDWDKLIKDRTEPVEFIAATDLGELLAKATLDRAAFS